MNKKIDKKFLVFDAKIFVERELYKSKKWYLFSRISFIFLNIISALAAFLVATLSVLVFSKVIWLTTPDWYFITTTGTSAITTFVLSLVNFFYVKDKMKLYKSRAVFIYSEIIKYESESGIYENSKNKDFDIFQRVSAHMDMKLAKEFENAKVK